MCCFILKMNMQGKVRLAQALGRNSLSPTFELLAASSLWWRPSSLPLPFGAKSDKEEWWCVFGYFEKKEAGIRWPWLPVTICFWGTMDEQK